MKALFCLGLTIALAPAFGSISTLRIQSAPHTLSTAGIQPNLMPGVAGVGLEVDGSTPIPCISCYGVPTGAIVLPPSYYVIAPSQQKTAVFFSSVETGNLSGPATFSLQITEAGSGIVILASTESGTLPPNSTNLISWSTTVPDEDGYSGPEGVVYTTEVGGVTVQNTAHIWVVSKTSLGDMVTEAAVQPLLMPGIAGVGPSNGSPLCISCYGVPTGAIVIPGSYYIVAPVEGVPLAFFNSVEVGNISGAATISILVTEATTGKVVLTFTGTGTLQSNATDLMAWSTGLPDGDGYEGLETIVYTTTIGNLSTQSTTHLWAIRHIPGN